MQVPASLLLLGVARPDALHAVYLVHFAAASLPQCVRPGPPRARALLAGRDTRRVLIRCALG